MSPRPAFKSKFRAPRAIFWVGLLLRVATITLAHTYRVRVFQDHFQFGWEMGRVARALVTGYGYADPFVGHTGPTAWVPPLYPLLLAGVFKLFGVYTATSAWIILTVNSVFSAATAIFIYEIAARCYNRRVALWSAWLWALYPAALQYAVHWIWDMSLTTFLFTCTLALALRMRGIGDLPTAALPADSRPRRPSLNQWLAFGLLWGLIALSNPTLLLFLPVCGLWILLGSRPLGPALGQAALAAAVFFVFLGSWTLRNARAFHAFVPIRTNLGVELWAWNNSHANGIGLIAPIQPVSQDPSFVPYARMGELAYSRYRGRIAMEWIRTHPRRFSILSLTRFYYYWVSVPHPLDKHPAVEYARELDYCFLSLAGWMGLLLSLKRQIAAASLFAWAFLLVPLTYYFVSVAARFRAPLEPLIIILIVYIFQSAESRRGLAPIPQTAMHE